MCQRIVQCNLVEALLNGPGLQLKLTRELKKLGSNTAEDVTCQLLARKVQPEELWDGGPLRLKLLKGRPRSSVRDRLAQIPKHKLRQHSGCLRPRVSTGRDGVRP